MPRISVIIWSGIRTSRVNAVLSASRIVPSVRSRQSSSPTTGVVSRRPHEAVAAERVQPRAGVDQRDRRHQVAALFGQRRGDGAAGRMPDDGRAAHPELIEYGPDPACLLRDAVAIGRFG